MWLADEDRLLLRSVHESEVPTGRASGARGGETPVERALCGAVVLEDEPVWVDDVDADPRAQAADVATWRRGRGPATRSATRPTW